MTYKGIIVAALLLGPAAGPVSPPDIIAFSRTTTPAPAAALPVTQIQSVGQPSPGTAAQSDPGVTFGRAGPQPPKPPIASADGFTAAPMPNVDQTAPTKRAPQGGQGTLGPSLFNTRNGFRGDGYLPSSSPQTEQEKHLHPTPGINFSVPLQ